MSVLSHSHVEFPWTSTTWYVTLLTWLELHEAERDVMRRTAQNLASRKKIYIYTHTHTHTHTHIYIYVKDKSVWGFDVNNVKTRGALKLQYRVHTHIIRFSPPTTRMNVPGLPGSTVTSRLVNGCIWLEKLLWSTHSQALVTEFCSEAFQYSQHHTLLFEDIF